jgi:predicted aspartyl protease
MKKILSLFACFLLLSAVHVGAQQDPPTNPNRQILAIPFVLQHGFLVVIDAQIDDLPGLHFIIDTGATHTIVDTTAANRLSLSLRHGKVLNYDHSVSLASTSLPDLQVGPVHFHDFPVMVGDLRHFSEFTDGVDGVLGLDILASASSLFLDYQRHLVLFTELQARDGRMETDAPAFTVQVSIQGQPLRLILDTGRAGMLLYSDRVHKHATHLEFALTSTVAHEGRLVGQESDFQSVRFGPDKVRVSAVLLSRAPNSLAPDIDGYVGADLLKAQKIELNFARHTLLWQ